MAEYVIVTVYCAGPNCGYRGKVSAQDYVLDPSSRRCPDCGATPLRIEVPGLAGSQKSGGDRIGERLNG